MWNTYHKKPEIGEAWKCPTCELMVTAGHKCQVRATVQCPDCRAMLEAGLEAKHHCPKKLERERVEREVQKKENRRIAAAKAAEKRASGLVTRIQMIKPKEEMTFMDIVDVYSDGTGRYEQVTVEKNPWKCRICGNVWQTEHEARDCAFERQSIGAFGTRVKFPHAKAYFKLYGARYFENGQPRGSNVREIEFTVMRVEDPEKLPEGKQWDMGDVSDEAKAEEILQKAYDNEREREKFEERYQTGQLTDSEAEEMGLERISPQDKVLIERDVATMPPEAQKIVREALDLPAPTPVEPEVPKLEPGVYKNGNDIYVVKMNREKTRVYAKKLVESAPRLTATGEQANFDFEYAAGAIYSLNAGMKMSIEEAKPYMIKYSRCISCGRFLKDKKSVERGIGPVCRKMFKE